MSKTNVTHPTAVCNPKCEKRSVEDVRQCATVEGVR
jgi:hypothetical protein